MQENLIEGIRKNNRKSQLQLYNMYYKAMYNTAYRILNNSEEAEDIMQECFLTAFSKISDYKGDASFGAWLKRIVINRSLDEVKKKKEMISIEEAGLQFSSEESTENYLEILACKVDDIRKSIEKLNDDDRTIISLFLLEGYDHEEIAQVLGISYNASRTRYSRAKQRLRDLLRQNKIDQLVN